MAGKNTSVFGIYTDTTSVDRAVRSSEGGGIFKQRCFRAFPGQTRHQGFRA